MSVQCCCAQASGYIFHRLGVKDGLLQEHTHSVCQDKRGFLWMSFRNGIQRYDGHRFLNFFTGKGTLPSGAITSMSMDPKGRLWVIINHTEAGHFDTDKFTWHAVKINRPAAFANAPAAMNFGDGSNIMLIYPGHGLLTYNEKANEFSQQYNLFTLPPGYEPKHIVFDSDKNYWMSASNGFVKYSTTKKLLSYAGYNAENDPFITAFGFVKNPNVIYADSLKRIWITYNDGSLIKSFNPANGEIKSWETVLNNSMKGMYYSFWGISHFSDGSLWLSGMGLLAKVNYEQNRVEPVFSNQPGEYSIRYDVIGTILEDREKTIWLCTDRGLYRFNPSAQHFQAIANRDPGNDKTCGNSVTGVLETADGEILVSTWGEGIFSYNQNFNPIVSKYVQRKKNYEVMVWCMLQTKSGDIWRGGQEGTLYIYEAGTKKTIFLTPDVCKKRTIRQLTEDKEGNIWLGTQGGHLVKWSPVDKQFRLQQQFKGLISRLYVDSNNDIWACTDVDGVFHINGEDGTALAHYTANGPAGKTLPVNGAADVIQHDDTTIIIASTGLSILNTKTKTFTYWDDGADITNMVKDKKGNLWLSTNKGVICRQFDKQWAHNNFDARDGINDFNFHVAAGRLLKNGRIIFGANQDFLVFDPEKAMAVNPVLPEVQLAGIAVMNKWLSVDSVRRLNQLHLTHRQHSLIIRFATNNHQSITPVEYMIEGIDKDWKNAGTDGEITLNYLPPGKYVLKATTKDGSGATGKIITLVIRIAAPFYKTWWFYSLLALAAGSLIYWLDRQRMKRKEAVQKMRSGIAGNLHQEVNMALQNINILSEMAKMKADRDIDKSKDFIEQIRSRSHNMMIAMDDMLWGIDPANDSMEKTILRLKEYIEALNNRHGIAFGIFVDEKVYQLNPGMQLRLETFLLFKESTALLQKYGVTDCRISIAAEKNMLLYTAEYAGSGVDEQSLLNQLPGTEMSRRHQAVKAVLETGRHASRSLFTLKVPV